METRLGALWIKGSGDKKFFSGTIEGPLELKEGEKLSIVVFHNKKTKDTQPDWNILKAIKKDSAKQADGFSDDIPFD
jgi:predicted DNA-binding antitoxin AbrB/MazE fold protein